ncbi:hypothetical protein KIL84_014052 [Mauremys mutica]|uniref:Secreted protein n=1 Tax=Mauremys mutica TaxID=74926 RepID=A0A9D3WWK2_9SAUR|nr:hypothetical protein KIL84_014052 [Mauremys mutica]
MQPGCLRALLLGALSIALPTSISKMCTLCSPQHLLPIANRCTSSGNLAMPPHGLPLPACNCGQPQCPGSDSDSFLPGSYTGPHGRRDFLHIPCARDLTNPSIGGPTR